jgi:RNA polymerase sigma-70 factor (ECF subfamily)
VSDDAAKRSPGGTHDQWDWALIRSRCRLEALRILRRPHEADEAVQEAMARAWRGRGSCRTPEAPLPWCLQITRREAFRLIGRERRSPAAEPLEDDVDDGRAQAERELTLLRFDIERALEQLSASERELITMRYEQDFSHPEIATRLRIPEATARVRLHRAHKRLQALLEGHP